jgi:glycine C-acetyltransferase
LNGQQGKLKEIAMKHSTPLLVDDAHGFTLGKTGAGAGEEQGVQDDIDVYFQLLQNQWLTLVLYCS